MEKIEVLYIKCGKHPEVIKIDDDLVAYQELVDGWIDNVYPYKRDYVLVCNDEGLILHFPPNAKLEYEDGGMTIIYGDFFIAKIIDTEEGSCYGSISDADIPYLLSQIHLIGKRF